MYNKKTVIFAVAVLSLLILGSVIFWQGQKQINQAEQALQARDYSAAASAYLQAARFFPWRTALYEQAGIAQALAGNYPEALVNLNQAAQLSERGWGTLALVYVQTQDFPAALTAYQNGLQKFPNSAALYAGQAAVYRAQKNWAEEKAALQNQIRFDEQNIYAHYRLGLLLTLLDSDEAFAELARAAKLDPQLDSVTQTLTTALNVASTQTDQAQRMVTLGRALGLTQEWELAHAAFAQALQLNAESAEAWAWLGEAEQQLGGDGGEALERAAILDPQSAMIHALRGLYWSRLQKYDQMLAEYALAAKLEPENPAWQAAVGDANLKRGDLAAALGFYKRATELAPNEPTYWRLLALLCAENGTALEELGLPAAQKAAELAPNDPLVLDTLGFVYFSSGRYASAEETLLSAVKLDPKLYSAYLHLALNYLTQGNMPAAFNALTYVRDANPNGADGARAKQLLERYFP
ncbi:MAG: tetratricopeptide repeat protein [Anaerolineales bacterium]|nr:tetratricopeptide repeat protein [Anaerolineales bacterium]